MEKVTEDYFKKFDYLLFNEKMKIVKMDSRLKDGHMQWEMDFENEIGKATFFVNENAELRDKYKIGEEVKLTIGNDDMCCNNRMRLCRIDDNHIEFSCDEEYVYPTSLSIYFFDKINAETIDLIYDHIYSIRLE